MQLDRFVGAAPLAVMIASALAGGCSLLFPVDELEGREHGLVQHATAQGSNTRSLMVTLPAPTSTDALIVVAASVNSTPISVSGGGVTWMEQAKSQSHVALAIWAGFVTPPGDVSTPVTVTWDASPDPAQTSAVVQLSEWKGPSAIGPAVITGGTGGPITTSELVVPASTSLLFAATGAHDGVINAPMSGFIALAPVVVNDTRLETAYQVAPPAGVYQTIWPTPEPDSWEALLASFGQ
jgi:hypothetical protein